MDRKNVLLVVLATLAWPAGAWGLGALERGPIAEALAVYAAVGLMTGVGLAWVVGRIRDPTGRHGSTL